MRVLRFRFFKLAARFVFVPLASLWVAGIAGCDPGVLDLLRGGLGDGLGLTPSTGLGGSCSAVYVDFVQTPSAAMRWNWGGVGDAFWGLTDGNWVDFMNRPVMPGMDYPIRASTSGLAFDMSAGNALKSYVFLLEYTLPKTICAARLTWETDVSLELPNGVCVSDPSVGDCSSSTQVRAVFQLVVIEDPTGQMSVLAPGRPLLNTRIMDALETMPPRDTIFFDSTDPNSASKSWSLRGDFDVLGGVEPRVFIGVAAQMGLAGGHSVCTNTCGSGDDSLLDNGVLLIESDAGIGVIMTRIE